MQIKAFTMLESLLVLGLVSILALGLSGSVQSTFAAVEEQIFFMEHHQDKVLHLTELGEIRPWLRLNFRPAKERFAINYI